MVLLLVFMQLTRDLFAIAKFLFNYITARYVLPEFNTVFKPEATENSQFYQSQMMAAVRL